MSDASAIPDGPHIRLTGALTPGDSADLYRVPVPDSSLAIRLQLRLAISSLNPDGSPPPNLVLYDSMGQAVQAPSSGLPGSRQVDFVITPSRLGTYQGDLVFGVARAPAGGLGGAPTVTPDAAVSGTAAVAGGSSPTAGSATPPPQSTLLYQLLIDRVAAPDLGSTTGAGTATGGRGSASNGLTLLSAPFGTGGLAIGLGGIASTGSLLNSAGPSLAGSHAASVLDVAGKIDTRAPLKGAAPFGGVLDDGPSVESLSGDALAGLELTELPVHAVSDAFDPVRGLVASNTEPNCDSNGEPREQPSGPISPPKTAQNTETDALWPVRHSEWLPAPILARGGLTLQRPADGRSGQSDRSAAEVAGRGTSSAEISTSLPTAPESNLDGRDLDRSRLSLWRTGLAFSCVLAFTTLLPEFTFWLKSLHPGQTRRRRGFRSPDSRSGRPGSTDPSRRPATP